MMGKFRTSISTSLAVIAGGLVILGLVGWSIDRSLRPGVEQSQGLADLAEADLEIEVQYQLAEERGAFHVLSADDPPLHSGDRVQIHVRAALPLYLYLYWSDSHGNARRLWPQDPKKQRQMVSLLLPRERDEWFPIEGPPGNEMVLVAAARTPLSDAQLARFEKLPQLLQSDETMAAPVWLPAGQSRRGVGGMVSAGSDLLDRDFLASLTSSFSGYRGLIFPHR